MLILALTNKQRQCVNCPDSETSSAVYVVWNSVILQLFWTGASEVCLDEFPGEVRFSFFAWRLHTVCTQGSSLIPPFICVCVCVCCDAALAERSLLRSGLRGREGCHWNYWLPLPPWHSKQTQLLLVIWQAEWKCSALSWHQVRVAWRALVKHSNIWRLCRVSNEYQPTFVQYLWRWETDEECQRCKGVTCRIAGGDSGRVHGDKGRPEF